MPQRFSSEIDIAPLPSDQEASGRSFSSEELQLLAEVLTSGVLTSTRGTMVKQFETEMAQHLGVNHVLACTSGTAAIHTAIAAINPEPGDEIITSPITDMGAVTPILYQTAIPVFVDVDPNSGNPTPASIATRISPRTRAIIATHLFGHPCEMADIKALADERNIPVIEDAAQAFGAVIDGKPPGTIGDIGCFSLQQGKHITTGEGGFVCSKTTLLAGRMRKFINKAWGYGDPSPDHQFLALNYRMSELQGAVGLAQVRKLESLCRIRQSRATLFCDLLADVDELQLPQIAPNQQHGYWRIPLILKHKSPADLAVKLKNKGITTFPNYIRKPAFQCELFQSQTTFGNSRFPFTLARPEAIDYDPDQFPGVFSFLDRVLVIGWNERLSVEDVHYIANQIRFAIQKCG